VQNVMVGLGRGYPLLVDGWPTGGD